MEGCAVSNAPTGVGVCANIEPRVFPEDSTNAQDFRTKNPRCDSIKSLNGASASGASEIVKDAVEEVPQIPMNAPSNIVILHRTLVADGGLPPGYERIIYSGPGTGVSRTTS